MILQFCSAWLAVGIGHSFLIPLTLQLLCLQSVGKLLLSRAGPKLWHVLLTILKDSMGCADVGQQYLRDLVAVQGPSVLRLFGMTGWSRM